MPAKNEFGNNKMKKKGRAPSHQNKFAFAHNPCSKKTDKILALQNTHVCQRCSDKIEWRKKYRKYKPRTQPGTCNECKKRNVKAAYHTICTKCTTDSVKAKKVIKAALQENPELEQQGTIRACAICVKVIALPDPEEEGDDRHIVYAMSLLKLRQRKALERKAAKEEEKSEAESKDQDNHTNDQEGHRPQGTLDSLAEEDVLDDNDVDYGDDEDDPFLKAVGGADKLLTGDAYQRKLLEQEQEKQ